MLRLLCQQALPNPVKGWSHAGKKITRTQSYGLPVCEPHVIKSLIAIIFAIVHLEANHTLSSFPSCGKKEETLNQ